MKKLLYSSWEFTPFIVTNSPAGMRYDQVIDQIGFCTGVLPVTMDDLTSGYNIAEILTLRPNFLNMLGLTHAETETYLRYVPISTGFAAWP